MASVARTGLGLYLVTLTGFRPRDLVSGDVHSNLSSFIRNARLGAVTLDPATASATVVVRTIVSGALADALASQRILVSLTWKMYPKNDQTGL